MGLDYSFRGLVYYQGRKPGSMDMVLEELRVVHLDPQAARRDCVTGHSLSIGDL